MKIETEIQPGIDVIRYSGTHSCKDADHEQDESVHEHIAGRLRESCNRFLIDVRDLRVAFGSGLGDLLKSWTAHGEGARRLAILWMPSHKNFDRLAFLSQAFEKGGGTGESNLAGHHQMRFFVDADAARTFLLNEE